MKRAHGEGDKSPLPPLRAPHLQLPLQTQQTPVGYQPHLAQRSDNLLHKKRPGAPTGRLTATGRPHSWHSDAGDEYNLESEELASSPEAVIPQGDNLQIKPVCGSFSLLSTHRLKADLTALKPPTFH